MIFIVSIFVVSDNLRIILGIMKVIRVCDICKDHHDCIIILPYVTTWGS